jgi:hypothetical protein
MTKCSLSDSLPKITKGTPFCNMSFLLKTPEFLPNNLKGLSTELTAFLYYYLYIFFIFFYVVVKQPLLAVVL